VTLALYHQPSSFLQLILLQSALFTLISREELPIMALATTQTLSKDSATDVDTNTTVFTLMASDLGRSEFSVAGLTLPAKKKLIVSHETLKDGTERHLVRIDRTEVDALLVPATASFHCVITRPPSTAITNAIVIEMVNQMIDFLIEGGSNANVTAILNNEN
jgi:hypothetical protein